MAVKIKGNYVGDLRCELTHQSGSSIQTDAPLDNHGKGEAFSPTDLVAAALASCMLTVLAIRANSKSIPIGQPSFLIKKSMGSNPRRISEVQIEFSFNEVISEKNRIYLESEAKKCPVALSVHPDLLQSVAFKYI